MTYRIAWFNIVTGYNWPNSKPLKTSSVHPSTRLSLLADWLLIMPFFAFVCLFHSVTGYGFLRYCFLQDWFVGLVKYTMLRGSFGKFVKIFIQESIYVVISIATDFFRIRWHVDGTRLFFKKWFIRVFGVTLCCLGTRNKSRSCPISRYHFWIRTIRRKSTEIIIFVII